MVWQETTFSSTSGKPRRWWWTSSTGRAPPTPVSINGDGVEMVDTYMLLDMLRDLKLETETINIIGKLFTEIDQGTNMVTFS